eukprot:141204-Chlamydomonas_euryale.AAC.1
MLTLFSPPLFSAPLPLRTRLFWRPSVLQPFGSLPRSSRPPHFHTMPFTPCPSHRAPPPSLPVHVLHSVPLQFPTSIHHIFPHPQAGQAAAE